VLDAVPEVVDAVPEVLTELVLAELVEDAVVEEVPEGMGEVTNWPPGGPEDVVDAVPEVLAELLDCPPEVVEEALGGTVDDDAVVDAVPEVLAELVDTPPVVEEVPDGIGDVTNWPPGGPEDVVDAVPKVLTELVDTLPVVEDLEDVADDDAVLAELVDVLLEVVEEALGGAVEDDAVPKVLTELDRVDTRPVVDDVPLLTRVEDVTD
jgi:hypothetical protein